MPSVSYYEVPRSDPKAHLWVFWEILWVKHLGKHPADWKIAILLERNLMQNIFFLFAAFLCSWYLTCSFHSSCPEVTSASLHTGSPPGSLTKHNSNCFLDVVVKPIYSWFVLGQLCCMNSFCCFCIFCCWRDTSTDCGLIWGEGGRCSLGLSFPWVGCHRKVVTSDGACVAPVFFARFSRVDGRVSAPGTAEGSAGDALKAGSASPCSWWLCWPVTRGTEAAASPRFGPAYRTCRAP